MNKGKLLRFKSAIINATFWGAVFILAGIVLGSFYKVGINEYSVAMFRDMVDGTAHKPYALRALAPAIIRTIENNLPASLECFFYEIAQMGMVTELFHTLKWDVEYAPAYFSASFVLYTSLILLVVIFRRLTRQIFHINEVLLKVLSLIMLAGLPCFFGYYSYLYDFPHLVLFYLAMYLLSAQKWKLYLVLFPFCCISKETAILLPFLFMIHNRTNWRMRSYWGLLCSQAVIFITCKVLLAHIFKNNLGGNAEFHLGHNITLSPYGFPMFLSLISLLALTASYWKEKPSFLKDSLWMIVPLIFLAFFLGLLDEYRVYCEVYFSVLLLGSYPVAKFLGLKMNTKIRTRLSPSE